MPDYQMISSIKKHSGPVACGKCFTEMEVLRGAILPSKTSRSIAIFAEFQCPKCGHIIVFRKNIPVGRKK